MLHAPDTETWDVYSSQTLELGTLCHSLGHNHQYEYRCLILSLCRKESVFTVCVSQQLQHCCSDLLLAVMLAQGGKRAASHCSSVTCRIQTHQLLLHTGSTSVHADTRSEFLLVHNVDWITVSTVNIWGVNLCIKVM